MAGVKSFFTVSGQLLRTALLILRFAIIFPIVGLFDFRFGLEGGYLKLSLPKNFGRDFAEMF